MTKEEIYNLLLLPKSKGGLSQIQEKGFSELLSNAGIKHEREFHINGYSYDFKIENILVEINPTITHNSLVNVFGGKPLSQDYHKSKTLAAQKAGYRCVHVWDCGQVTYTLNCSN